MTCFAVSNKYLAVTKGLHIDLFDHSDHHILQVPPVTNLQETDILSDVTISGNNKSLAAVTSSSKRLVVFCLDAEPSESCKVFELPRSSSKIRFTDDNSQILVADKTGDVLIYNIISESNGTKLLGHLSLLLDVLQTNNKKYILTSDRDEKIRVTCYPNTYSIQTYCLGHKEFVNHLDILPHDNEYLVSSSGDGTLKIWQFVDGKLCYSIDTCTEISNPKLKEDFVKVMDEEGIEVMALPVVHFSITQLTETSSLIAVTVHSYNAILIYSIKKSNNKLTHNLECKLNLVKFPAAVKLHNKNLFVYDDSESKIQMFNIKEKNGLVFCELHKTYNMFENILNENCENTSNHLESIKVLYKRKFDNVQEYQDRKRQRLEKLQ